MATCSRIALNRSCAKRALTSWNWCATFTSIHSARLVEDLDGLARYPYSGHSVLMGRIEHAWQDTQGVLGMLGEKGGACAAVLQVFRREGDGSRQTSGSYGWGSLEKCRRMGRGVKALKEERVYQRNDYVKVRYGLQ
jgi:putative transposase